MSFDWQDRKVLVTGANGFIGSWLVEALVEKGAKVTAFVKPGDIIDTETIRHLSDKVDIVYGDIRDFQKVFTTVKDQEFLFHLAAVTQVIYAIKNPRETYDVNIVGTLNVLEALRLSDQNQFLIFASTDKVYGEPKYVPIDEEHPLLGKSPYDASKIAAEKLVNAFHSTYGLRTSISRWSNTYGGREFNILRGVPDFIISLLNEKPPIIRGHGKHVRDYMHVRDAVSGMLSLAENSKISNGEAFNFGTESPTTVLELAEKIISIMGKPVKPIILNKPTLGEIENQYLLCTKAKEKLKWWPQINLGEGLKETINWYQNNQWFLPLIEKARNFFKMFAQEYYL